MGRESLSLKYLLYLCATKLNQEKQMKKMLFLVAAAAMFAACNNNPEGYVINGTIEGAADGDSIYIMNLNNVNPVATNAAVINGGKFTFKGVQEKPENTYLAYKIQDQQARKYASFFLENGKMTAFLGEDENYVKGTTLNDAFEAYKGQIKDATHSIEAEEEKMKDATEEQKAAIEDKINGMLDDYYAIFEDNIDKNIDNPLGVYILKSFYYQMETEKLADVMGKIPAELSEGDDELARIREVVDKKIATAPGQKFTDFAMKTPEGKDIKLSDYAGQGKVVLVDFWASWCGPCRVEMPNVIEAYAKYKNKGFEIVGVSLDRNEADWKKGIEDLGITWPQMSDVKYWDCAAANIYGIQAIPATVLIDKDGTILKRDLRGADLAEELEKLLG